MAKRAKLEDGKLQIFVNKKWLPVALDDYKELLLIGEGANGVVLSGYNKRLERREAIKVYIPNPKSKNGKVSQEQYLREIKKLANLKNPNIVMVYSAFEQGQDVHVVTMEYLEGITLSQWVTQRYYIDELDKKVKCVQLARQILETVLFYQERGIIHGDLHANNIMITGGLRDTEVGIHIFDFGTSLFSKEGQSNQRESYFVYELTQLVLGKYFDEKYFTITGVKRITDKFIKNDVRKKYPLLVTKTMLSYVQMLDSILQMEFTDLENHYERIVPAIVALTKGVYVNTTHAVNLLYSALKQKVPVEKVWEITIANMEERCFPEIPSDYAHVELRYKNSFEVYFQMAMETREHWDIAKTKEFTFQHAGKLTDAEYNVYIQIIFQTNKSSYADLVKPETWDEDIWRMVVYDALVIYFGNLRFLEEVWVRFNEYECFQPT